MACDWCGCYMDQTKASITVWDSKRGSCGRVYFCSNKCASEWEQANPDNEENKESFKSYKHTDEYKREQERERRIYEAKRREEEKEKKLIKRQRFIVVLAHIVAFIVNPCFCFISDKILSYLFSIIYSVIFFWTSWKTDDDYDRNIGNLDHLVIYSVIGLIGFFAIYFFL